MKTKLSFILALVLCAISVSSCANENSFSDHDSSLETGGINQIDYQTISDEICYPLEDLMELSPERLNHFIEYWTLVQHIQLEGYDYIFNVDETEAEKLGVSRNVYNETKEKFKDMTDGYIRDAAKGYTICPFDPDVFVRNAKKAYEETKNNN